MHTTISEVDAGMEHEQELVRILYSCTVKQDSFDDFLEVLCERLNLRCASLAVRDTENNNLTAGWSYGLTDEMIIEYVTKWADHDYLVNNVLPSKPFGYFYTSNLDVDQIESIMQMPFFTQFAKKHDIVHGGGAVIDSDNGYMTSLRVQRSSEQGGFSHEEAEFIIG